MCTVVVLRRPASAWPLILAGNRDEMMNRAWRPPARHWPDRAETLGGFDVLAGGSWLAVNDHGVVAAILNRIDSLGPLSGKRSRGELVLEALDHADANAAASALAAIEPRSYRPFNLVVADNRDAFWIRHADPTGVLPPTVQPLPEGVSMLTSGDLDDLASPRVRTYLPRFRTAAAPDPEADDWTAWERLLASTESEADTVRGAMSFATETGFATVSSALVALPAIGRRGVPPRFRFADVRPEPLPWRDVWL